MTIRNAIGTVLLCTALIGATGTGIGYGLGKLSPGYYRAVFRSGREPGFDPVSVGIGLGLTQGTTGGVVVGLLIVALLCWREVRLQRANPVSTQLKKGMTSTGMLPQRILLITCAILMMGASINAAGYFGFVNGVQDANDRECSEQLRAASRILINDPAFGEVGIGGCDGSQLLLCGRVKSKSELTRLQEELTVAIGKKRAQVAVSCIEAP
jgi:hypothetical protein